MKTRKYTMYSDGGHGWLKVAKLELQWYDVGEQISPYSYQRGDYAYLEEDCDAPKFIKALDERGYTITIVEKTSTKQSKIRSYERYLTPVYEKQVTEWIKSEPLTI